MSPLDQEDIIKKERLFGIALLMIIAIFTVLDIYEDLSEGSTIAHTVSEVTVVISCALAALYLWRRVIGVWNSKTLVVTEALVEAREDARSWKEANFSLTRGLYNAIDQQLESWGLSPAQKDISLLLIKGLSFKEIADVRETSEHTVRQQAATIYRKSGLEGRAQLSAFFLEDLLSPAEQS